MIPVGRFGNPAATSALILPNLWTKTEVFDDAAWVKTNLTVTANATNSPLGSATADKLVSSATTNFMGTRQLFTAVSGTQYTASVYAKAAEWQYISLQASGSFGTVEGANSGIRFNSSTGAIEAAYNGQSTSKGRVDLSDNGFYRFSATWTANASNAVSSVSFFMSNLNNLTTPTGNGTNGLHVWGAMIHTGADLSIYQAVA